MKKKECIKYLNQMLEEIFESDCFEYLCDKMDIDEDLLELILLSKIINIKNDDLEE